MSAKIPVAKKVRNAPLTDFLASGSVISSAEVNRADKSKVGKYAPITKRTIDIAVVIAERAISLPFFII